MNTLDPELWFHERAAFYVEAQVLYHLNQCGVLERIAQKGRTTAGLAADLGLVEGVLHTLLEFVEGVDDLLARDESGCWMLTELGQAVVERFGRRGEGAVGLNLFDVRVGAYGPVWEACSEMLRGNVSAGQGGGRRGEIAAEAVYKVGARMAPALQEWVREASVDTVVEWGVTTGLLEGLEAVNRVGVDRNGKALEEASRRAGVERADTTQWIESDLFVLDDWLPVVPEGRSAFFSVHFHELLAAGEEVVVSLLEELGRRRPGDFVVALEQPRLSAIDRERVPRAQWLYSQSNVLIHHLVGKGQVLDLEAWSSLFVRGGCAPIRVESMGYLGYHLLVFELGATG